MVDYKITKTKKLLEVNNDMVHNYYFLVNGRFINKEKTKYKKFKFVVWFDIFDLQEYFDKDIIYENDIKDYLGEIIYTYIPTIEYEDKKGMREFYQFCNETIQNYNKTNCGV